MRPKAVETIVMRPIDVNVVIVDDSTMIWMEVTAKTASPMTPKTPVKDYKILNKKHQRLISHYQYIFSTKIS